MCKSVMLFTNNGARFKLPDACVLSISQADSGLLKVVVEPTPIKPETPASAEINKSLLPTTVPAGPRVVAPPALAVKKHVWRDVVCAPVKFAKMLFLII